MHFVHYTGLTRDLRGQIARLAELLAFDCPAQPLDVIADVFASGTSNKWEGRLTAEDLEAYRARISALLPPEDVAALEWGDRRAP